MFRSRPMASATCTTLAIWRLCASLSGPAFAQRASAPAADEPKSSRMRSTREVKLSSDRKTRGVSDTFNRPGAELTVDAARVRSARPLQLASVSKVTFPQQQTGSNPTLALGWRGGNPEGLHYMAPPWRVNGLPAPGSMPHGLLMSR